MHSNYCDTPLDVFIRGIREFELEYIEGPGRDAYLKTQYGREAPIGVYNGRVLGTSVMYACRTLEVNHDLLFAALKRAAKSKSGESPGMIEES